jgi:hypothetical protein
MVSITLCSKAIDGTHIVTKKPLGAFANDYCCFKMGKYIIVVAQVVVDCYKKIKNVFIGLLGSTNYY